MNIKIKKNLKRILASVALSALLSNVVFAVDFTVMVDTDDVDVNPGDGICASLVSDCSLRAAIMEVNSILTNDSHTIGFATDLDIVIIENLPSIAIDNLTITAGNNVISIDGSDSADLGLNILGDNVTIEGVEISNFLDEGILVDNVSDGTLLDGVVVENNGGDGVQILGTKVELKNSTISGNAGNGVFIDGASDVLIKDNKIGTDSTGLVDDGNAGDGIVVEGITDLNGEDGGVEGLIVDGNVISGNAGDGISFGGTVLDDVDGDVLIQNNYIGVDYTGNDALGNDENGISASDTADVNFTIGAGNVISANAGDGILLNDANVVEISGNNIGLGADGVTSLGNAGHGVNIPVQTSVPSTASITIGGDRSANANVIASNGGAGVYINDPAADVEIYGNIFGLSADQSVDLTNAFYSVFLENFSFTVNVGKIISQNIVNNNSHIGMLFSYASPVNEDTLADDNVCTDDSVEPAYECWVILPTIPIVEEEVVEEPVVEELVEDPVVEEVLEESVVVEPVVEEDTVSDSDSAVSAVPSVASETLLLAFELYEVTVVEESEFVDAGELTIEKLITDKFTYEEELNQLREDVQILAEESIVNTLETLPFVELNLGVGQSVSVQDSAAIDIVFTIGLSEEELSVLRDEAEDAGRLLIELNEGSDLDNDGISDLIQLSRGLPLFVDDFDGDGFTTAEEFFFGFSANEVNFIPETPEVTNLDGFIADNMPSVRIVGQAGDYVNVTFVDANSYEIYEIGNVTVDDRFKAEISLNSPLPNGDYYIVLKGENGEESIAKVTIDSSYAVSAPILALSESSFYSISGDVLLAQELGFTVELVLGVWEESTNSSYITDVYSGGYDKEQVREDVYTVLNIDVEPGMIVYVAWKSVILSSVVLSDASQGSIEMMIPDVLPPGEHEIIVYAYDKIKRTVSNPTRILIRR